MRPAAGLDSPDPALNQAVAWAVARAGGHLRVNPARAGDGAFEADDLEELLDDARRWHRVRDPGVLDPEEFLARVVGGLFGVRADGAGGRLEVCPFVAEGWRAYRLRRVRSHRTLLDLEVRPRADWVTVRLAVTFGPPPAVVVALPDDVAVNGVSADETPLEGVRAVFTAIDEHEVVFFTG
jgi:hypothetical protein